MGSSSSRLGSRSSRPRLNRRLSSLICGGSTSRAQPENQPFDLCEVLLATHFWKDTWQLPLVSM
ncbi:unnamed protein product, partial [Vitis vinifera]